MVDIFVGKDLFVLIGIVKLSEEQAVIGFVVRSCNLNWACESGQQCCCDVMDADLVYCLTETAIAAGESGHCP